MDRRAQLHWYQGHLFGAPVQAPKSHGDQIEAEGAISRMSHERDRI